MEAGVKPELQKTKQQNECNWSQSVLAENINFLSLPFFPSLSFPAFLSLSLSLSLFLSRPFYFTFYLYFTADGGASRNTGQQFAPQNRIRYHVGETGDHSLHQFAIQCDLSPAFHSP